MKTLPIDFLIKDSPAPVVILDKKMIILNHSDEWLNKHGIDETSHVGKSIFELSTEFPKEFNKILKECFVGGKNNNSGSKFYLSNEEIIWLSWKIKPWRNANKDVVGLIVILENVTKEKQRQELLLKAQQVARIGGWEVDLISNKVFWTDITREIHEMPYDYIPNLEDGINFYKAGKHRENISLLVSEAISKGTSWNTECIIITSTGKEVWVSSRGEAEIINGKCVRLFGTFQDINEQKKVDLKLKEISERLAIATNAAGVGIWEYDIIENVLLWDSNMYTLYGIDKKDFSGDLEAWESSIHPEDKERSQKELEMAILGEKDFSTDFRIVRSNGEINHIQAESVVQKNALGKPFKMIGINWDISKTRKAELKLQNLYKITQEQNEGLQNFAYIVSHNLKTHTNNLSNLSGVLADSMEGRLEFGDYEKKNVVKMITKAAKGLNKTISHLNEVVQIRSNIKEKIEKIELNASLKGVIDDISNLIEEKKALYEIHIDKHINVMAVPAYLDSILLNLFTNSLRYAHPKRSPKIHISASKVKDNIVLTFRDNGLGIDLEKYGNRLFGLYSTFHNHAESQGIGLFMTKNQMIAMGGKIEVESEVGKWTEFSLYFKY